MSAHTLQVPGIDVDTGRSLTWPDFIIMPTRER